MSPMYRVKFSLEMFKPETRGTVELYLDGYINAAEACRLLKWSKETWERHMAAIFSLALNEEYPEAEIERCI